MRASPVVGPALGVAMMALSAAASWGAVSVRVQLAQRSVTVGESVNLEVTVIGATGAVVEPDLGLPDGVEVLASSRKQDYSWVNGSSTASVTFLYEIAPGSAGHYRIGPVRVRNGSQVYEASPVDLDVTAAPHQISGRATGGVSLMTDVSPRTPYVGQLVLLKVRLVQGSTLAEDPQYTPPATSGFWSERTSEPESYYAQQGGRRVLVTETRTRLYPLAPGTASIGEASASVVLAEGGGGSFSIFSGARRSMVLRSDAVGVAVRPLPSGAPAGYSGAVGRFVPAWTVDREQTARDVPVLVSLDVRGAGNLPLLKTPVLEAPDFEIFSSTLEDSLPAPGSSGDGCRRFRWTLLPRRAGILSIEPPAFSWFDPEAGAYRTVSREPATLRVTAPAGGRGTGPEEAFPSVFVRRPADPTATAAVPWGLAAAGAMLGGSLMLWRRSRHDRNQRAALAQQREWLRAVGLARGPEFWDAADRAAGWLTEQGRPVGSVPREIASARYGGTGTDEDRIRRRMIELLSSALEGGQPRAGLRLASGLLLVAGLAVGFLFGPHGGGEGERLRARRADEMARLERFDAARVEWLALWRLAQSPGLAARLAWYEIRRGRVGEAAAWVVRGDLGEPRDPALGYVAERVSEAGGLSGERFRRIPLRSFEWGLLAALLAGLGVASWPRRSTVALLLGAAAVLAAGPDLERSLDGHTERGALMQVATIEGTSVELEPGQVVRIVRRERDRVWVRVGELEGWLPGIAVAGTGAAR